MRKTFPLPLVVLLSAAALVLAPACSGDPAGLSKEEVTSVPPGDAVGGAVSGQYNITVVVTDCRGACPLITSGWLTISTCDVGTRITNRVDIEQQDGRLQLDADSSNLYFTRLVGGYYHDEHFDVGGYATQLAGAVQMFARVQGTISAAGQLGGQGQARGVGDLADSKLDCTVLFTVEGEKR